MPENSNGEVWTVEFANGNVVALSDISYAAFMRHVKMSGASDIAREQILSSLDMQDITDFDAEAIAELTLVVTHRNRQRTIRLKAIFDSDDDNLLPSEAGEF